MGGNEQSRQEEIAVAAPFVWFDLRCIDAAKTRAFHEQLFGWEIAEVPVGDGTVPMIGGDEP